MGWNHQLVNCWFGLVVWIPRIPLRKGVLLKDTRFEGPKPPARKPTINHCLDGKWLGSMGYFTPMYLIYK